MRVGGSTGDTELTAVDHYNSKILTVQKSSSIDMLVDDAVVDLVAGQNISIIQVTDFSVLITSDYRDTATQMVLVDGDFIATATFERDGEGIVTLTGDFHPKLSYLGSTLETVASSIIQLEDANFPQYDIGAGSVFAVSQDNLLHIFVVLSHNENSPFTTDDFMESRLLYLTKSATDNNFQIKKVVNLKAKEDLSNSGSFDPVNIISGFSFIKPTNLCADSSRYSIAYWASYADTLDSETVQQMSCLEVYCSISQFYEESEPTRSVCIKDPSATYQYNRLKASLPADRSFKRKPNQVYLPDYNAVVSVRERNSKEFDVSFVLIGEIDEDDDDDDDDEGSIETKVIAIIVSFGDEYRLGNLELVDNQLYLPITVRLSSDDSQYSVRLLQIDSDFTSYEINVTVTNIVQVLNQEMSGWPVAFAFQGPEPDTQGSVKLGYGLTTSDLQRYDVEYEKQQTFLFLSPTVVNDSNSYMCPPENPEDIDFAFAQPDSSLDSEAHEYITDQTSQIQQDDSLANLSESSLEIYAATNRAEPLPWNECVAPSMDQETLYSSQLTTTTTEPASDQVLYMIPLEVPLSLCYYRLNNDPILEQFDSNDSAYLQESETDNDVYLYLPVDDLSSEGSINFRITFVYGNNQQTIERNLKIISDATCSTIDHISEIPMPQPSSSSFEELEYPYTATFGSSGNLEIGFTFRPEVMREDPISLVNICSQNWGYVQLKSITGMNSTEQEEQLWEMTDIFERLEISYEVVNFESQSFDFFEHILVSFNAIVREEWAVDNKDAYPVFLRLLFEQTQEIQGEEYPLDTFVTVELDYACLFSVELLAPPEVSQEFFAFTTDMAMSSFPIEQIQLPDFEVFPLDCASATTSANITRQVTVTDSDGVNVQLERNPWLKQTSCCLELVLNNYQTIWSNDTETTTCYNATTIGGVTTYPGYQQTASYTQPFCITEVPMQPFGFETTTSSQQVLRTGYYGEEIMIDVPGISSSLPYIVTFTVDSVEVPLGECAACPIQLEQMSGNQYVIIALIEDPSTEDDATTKTAATGQTFKLEVTVIDTLERSIQVSYILELERSPREPNVDVDDVDPEDVDEVDPELNDNNTNSTIVEEVPKDKSLMIEGVEKAQSGSNKGQITFSTTSLMQIDYIASMESAQETKLTSTQKKLTVLPWAPKMMTKDGKVKIRFQPAILKPSMEAIARLKAEGLMGLKLIPSDDTMNMLVPSSLEYDWKVVDVTRKFMDIQVDFTYPLNISMVGDQDSLQISFNQVLEVLVPAQQDIFQAIPADYTIFVRIPPQKGELLDLDQWQLQIDSEEVSQQMLFGVTVTSISTVLSQFFFTYTLQTCLSMIHGIQIASHLPLNNVTIPANAQILFDELVRIAAFDIFEPAEHFDLRISQTEAYNEKFEQLGYQSLNVVENMGSIVFFLCFVIIKIIVTFLVILCGCSARCCKVCCRRQACCRPICKGNYFALLFNHQMNTNLAIQFMYQTSFEIMICAYIGLSFMDQLKESGKEPLIGDKASNFINYFILAMLVVFIVTIIEFILRKSHTMHSQAREEIKYRYDKIVKSQISQASFQKQHSTDGSQVASIKKSLGVDSQNSSTMIPIKENSKQLELPSIQKLNAKHVKRQRQISKSKFGFYEVLYSNLRMQRSGARFFSLVFVTRRFLLAVIIFKLNDEPWLQLVSFVTLCLIAFAYMVTSKPLAFRLDNKIEVLNEGLLLFTGYLFMVLTGITVTPIQVLAAGDLILVTVLCMVVLDLLIVIYMIIKGLILTFRKKVYRAWLISRHIDANYVYNKTKWHTRKLRKSVMNWQMNSSHSQVQVSVEDIFRAASSSSSSSSSQESHSGSSIESDSAVQQINKPFATIKEEKSMEDVSSDSSGGEKESDSASNYSNQLISVKSCGLVDLSCIDSNRLRLRLSEDSDHDSLKSFDEADTPAYNIVGMSKIILDRKPIVKQPSISSSDAPHASESYRESNVENEAEIELMLASNLRVLVDQQSKNLPQPQQVPSAANSMSDSSKNSCLVAPRIQINQLDLSSVAQPHADLSDHTHNLAPCNRPSSKVSFESLKSRRSDLRLQKSSSSYGKMQRDRGLSMPMNKGILLHLAIEDVPFASQRSKQSSNGSQLSFISMQQSPCAVGYLGGEVLYAGSTSERNQMSQTRLILPEAVDEDLELADGVKPPRKRSSSMMHLKDQPTGVVQNGASKTKLEFDSVSIKSLLSHREQRPTLASFQFQ